MRSTQTTTSGARWKVTVPEDTHTYMKVQAVLAKTTLRDWVEEALRQLLRERREWEPSNDHEFFGYFALPKNKKDDVKDFFFAVEENFGEIVKEQVADDAILLQEFVWTAIYNAVQRSVQAE